jgi:hypothetical protein
MSSSVDKQVEVIEKDTTDDENLTISSIFELLRPNHDIIDKIQSYSSSFNRSVFDGWVKQPSPCCAAAVVSGAWNSLAMLHRSDPAALNHHHALRIYINMFQYAVRTKKQSFERKLGGNVDLLLSSIEEELLPTGRYIGGKKDKAVTKKILLEVVKRIVSNHLARKLDAVNIDQEAKPSSLDLFAELLQQEDTTIPDSDNPDAQSDSVSQ